MFLDSLDIANRACQHLGVSQIDSPSEDSTRCYEITNAYDKLRRAELRRNVWRFAIRKVALRPLTMTTRTLVPSIYDASKTYLLGEIVQDTNGLWWISEEADNVNNAPGGNNEAWEMYFGPRTADLWDSGTSYFAGEMVYVLTGTTPNGYQAYMSLTSANDDTPGTATVYDATVQYAQDDAVSYGGFQWRSLLPVNVGNTPAVGPLAWSAATAYTAGQQVTGSDNYIYTALGNTTGNDPVTDGGVHWATTFSAYDSLLTYPVGAVVLYNNQLYVCASPNGPPGVTPGTNPIYWTFIAAISAMNAWARSPTIIASSVNWRPIVATLKNVTPLYPLGAGPQTQTSTKNLFRLPNGFLREAPQDPRNGLNPLGGPNGIDYSDFEYDGNFIVSPATDAIIFRFVADITKVSAMDDMFCEGIGYRVALATCMKLTQSVTKLQEIRSQYKEFMGEARMVNGIEEGTQVLPDDEYLQVRM